MKENAIIVSQGKTTDGESHLHMTINYYFASDAKRAEIVQKILDALTAEVFT